jgi:hypothetical protein
MQLRADLIRQMKAGQLPEGWEIQSMHDMTIEGRMKQAEQEAEKKGYTPPPVWMTTKPTLSTTAPSK